MDQYVAFGLSANPSQVSMVGGDVTVAWINASTGAVSAVDYYLQSYSQVYMWMRIILLYCIYVDENKAPFTRANPG